MNPPHYVYRVDHDVGFAPHVRRGVCTVCGCKSTTVERWARKGSWVVGLGGVGTGRKDSLIYAMQVDDTPPYAIFKEVNPKLASYLDGVGIAADAPVLVSRKFYYFGNRSPVIPRELHHIIHPTQGCKRVTDADIALLKRLVLDKYSVGKHGTPNNSESSECGTCGPRSDSAPKANKRLKQIAPKRRSC